MLYSQTIDFLQSFNFLNASKLLVSFELYWQTNATRCLGNTHFIQWYTPWYIILKIKIFWINWAGMNMFVPTVHSFIISWSVAVAVAAINIIAPVAEYFAIAAAVFFSDGKWKQKRLWNRWSWIVLFFIFLLILAYNCKGICHP